MKVLWLAPTFNHYKARFLKKLADHEDIDLTVLSGTGRTNMGDQDLRDEWNFKHVQVNVSKDQFGKSKIVQKKISDMYSRFDWILVPAEKKNIPLLLFTKNRIKNSNVRLFSYNHPAFKSRFLPAYIDRLLSRYFFSKLDRVIFYTEQAKEWAVKKRLVKQEKAYFASNTIDTTSISKQYNFITPDFKKPSILFIGRLIPSKRIDLFLEYIQILTKEIPNLSAHIIGDGPEAIKVKNAQNKLSNITWHGKLVEHEDISPIMEKSSLIFVPGLSGLSINHAFAYGRPYVTLENTKHGPEISYIKDGSNGLILTGNQDYNVLRIKDLLKSNEELEQYSKNAWKRGKELSIENWVAQFTKALSIEE